jgi:membrane fusion protein, heavy metal efflux system
MIVSAKTLICVATLVFSTFSAPALAHEGHDEAPAPQQAAAVPRLVAEGSDVELVAVAQGHTLTLYLDRIATNEPVTGAKIEVAGEGLTPTAVEELGNGVYEIEGSWVDEPGSKPLTFTVTAEGSADLLAGILVIPSEEETAGGSEALWKRPVLWLLMMTAALGGFFVSFAFRPIRLEDERLPPDERSQHAAPGSVAPSPRSPDARVPVILAAAFALAALNAPAAKAHEGHDHGEENAAPVMSGIAPSKSPTGDVFLPKATQRLLRVRTQAAKTGKAHAGKELVGTVVADPAHEGRVQAPMDGQVELAEGELSYVGKSVTAGEILALIAPAMPVYERGTLQQVTADVEGKLRIAEQKLARLTRISGDYVPQREIDDTKSEIESLREQKRVLEPKAGERLELKAPVSGIISVANVRAGQVVSARDTLFEVVDPKRLWIEAIGIAGTDDEAPVTDATAVDAEGHTIPLSYVGRAPALRQQSVQLLFKVGEAHASLAIGVTVKVLVQHGSPIDGIVVPGASVVRGTSGLHQVWVKVAPERFAPRPVRVVPLDGERMIVTGGLADGDRVVVDGAEIINQVR